MGLLLPGLLAAALASPAAARAPDFAEVRKAALHDPDYYDLGYGSRVGGSAGGFPFNSLATTLLRDSTTHYRETRATGSATPLITRANRCYIAERNELRWRDTEEHVTPLARDTVFRLLQPYAALIDSIPPAAPVRISDSLWAVESVSDSVSWRLEYDSRLGKVAGIRKSSPAESLSAVTEYAFHWDSLQRDTIVYPKVTRIRIALYSPELKRWTLGVTVDSTLYFSRPHSILNALFLARDQAGQTVPCDDGTSIRISSPQPEALWAPGSVQTIRWETEGVQGGVYVEYFKRSGVYDLVAVGSDSLPEVTWTVPPEAADLSAVRIRARRTFAEAIIRFRTRIPSSLPPGSGGMPAASGTTHKRVARSFRLLPDGPGWNALGRWLRKTAGSGEF